MLNKIAQVTEVRPEAEVIADPYRESRSRTAELEANEEGQLLNLSKAYPRPQALGSGSAVCTR